MKDQPVDWNRKFEEKKKSSDRVQETHSTRFLIFCPKQGVQWRVADDAEDQDRSAQHKPGPLRPTLVGAPQAPTRQTRARHNIQKTRHSRYIRLCRHGLPFLVKLPGVMHLSRRFALHRAFA
jgi:hypothetical protein